MRAARAQGNLSQQAADLRAEIDSLAKQAAIDLKRLGLWSGPLEAIETLAMPSPETIERFDRELSEVAARNSRCGTRSGRIADWNGPISADTAPCSVTRPTSAPGLSVPAATSTASRRAVPAAARFPATSTGRRAIRSDHRPRPNGRLLAADANVRHVPEPPAHLPSLLHQVPLAVQAVADHPRGQDDENLPPLLGLGPEPERGPDAPRLKPSPPPKPAPPPAMRNLPELPSKLAAT